MSHPAAGFVMGQWPTRAQHGTHLIRPWLRWHGHVSDGKRQQEARRRDERTLFYHLLPTDEYIVPAGLFQSESFQLASQIFIDEKPDFYELKNETPTLTGQQVFEQFAPKP